MAFAHCTGFKCKLILRNSIEEIWEGVFKGCSGFTGSLTIPSSVSSESDAGKCLLVSEIESSLSNMKYFERDEWWSDLKYQNFPFWLIQIKQIWQIVQNRQFYRH